MLVTLLGISIEVKPLQSRKAAYPMLVTLLGIVIEHRLEQFLKAAEPIHFVPVFIEYEDKVLLTASTK